MNKDSEGGTGMDCDDLYYRQRERYGKLLAFVRGLARWESDGDPYLDDAGFGRERARLDIADDARDVLREVGEDV